MFAFDDDYIDRLNRTREAGKFLKAVTLTESISPLVKKYYVDHEETIVFGGNTYERLHMQWQSLKTSANPAEGATVSVSNIGGEVIKYLKEFDITGNEVVLELLHLDLLSTLTNYWKRRYKILAARYDVLTATFDVGRQLGRNRLPRGVILKDRYPGINSDVPRIF
jgi:hypothetical protein